MELLCNGLKHPQCKIETLQLDGEILTTSCSRHLAEVFMKNQRLKELELSLKSSNDKTMELLCNGLNNPECTIKKLKFSGEILSESFSRHVADVFRKNPRLRVLHLDIQNLDDKTMELLCNGLKHPQCKIETLQLGGKISTASCGRHLAEVLRENQRLRKLELTFKSPDDKTMELLCDGLNDPECTVKELKLGGEILTMSCSRHLAEVLRRNQRLRELELALKNPDAKTMELLCEGLKHPQCTIEILDLDGETLTELSSRHLAEVLRKNQRLDTLFLSLKNPDDKPMEELCEGLKHPECTIEILHLAGETLTESSSRHLAEVLRKNQRLNVLFLSLKIPDDKAMEVLCEGLKHPECAIETLELAEEILTESCSRHLAEALRRNQRLRELSLSLKNPDDKTMELLCEGLKHPQCTIETLQLDGEILTTSCSRHLAEVFMKNQRLKELELSLKRPNDKTMELLCNGLNNPECTIKKLKFSGEILSESCSRHLAEVLRKKLRLRELDLSLKNSDDKPLEMLWDGLKQPECAIETVQLNGKYIIQNGKWKETAMVESPARNQGGVKRLASSESLQSRKRRRPDHFQNP